MNRICEVELMLDTSETVHDTILELNETLTPSKELVE